MIEIDEWCVDCRANVIALKEYFHVRDHVWTEATKNRPVPEGKCLCIGCLEARLGRTLVFADFTHTPCNYSGGRSDRFKSRFAAR